MALKAIGVVSSRPAAGTLPGQGAASGAVKISAHNGIRLTGQYTAGTGKIFLLRWEPDLSGGGQWRPWRSAQAVVIDGSELEKCFDAIFAQESGGSNYYLLYAVPAITVASAHVEEANY